MSAPGTGYLALGDSYTIGEGIDAAGRWPVQLANALRAEGHAIEAPRVIARTGWSTAELSAAMDEADAVQPLAGQRLVSLLIGVNDQYRGYPLAEYAAAFAPLLDRAIALAAGGPHHVLVLSIPDWGVTPFGRASGRDVGAIAEQLDAYNACARAACAARGVGFIDITGIGRVHADDLALLAEDGLHPSAELYARWTRQALPAARQALAA